MISRPMKPETIARREREHAAAVAARHEEKLRRFRELAASDRPTAGFFAEMLAEIESGARS